MSETTRVVVPYESMDPLAIGATDDESKKHRDTLEVEIPTANLVTVVQPDEPAPVGGSDRGRTPSARRAGRRPDVRRPPRGQGQRRRHRRQPVPPDSLVEAPARRLRRDRGGRRDRRPRLLREREGLPDVGDGHRAEARSRQPRAHGAERLVLLAERPAEPGRVHVRRCLVGRHARLAAEGGRVRRREDHDRPGAGEPLGRRRRWEADPPRRRLRRDDRVESLRVRHVAADALRRVRRADALGHRRGRDDVRARLHDERPARHAWPRDGRRVRLASRGAP